MPTYVLYKNSIIINIIEADPPFVDALVSNGTIDSYILRNRLPNQIAWGHIPISYTYP